MKSNKRIFSLQGEFPDVDPKKFTDEELGIPPDDADV